MGEAFRGERGGILSLLRLPREQWEAIEVDLARAGWTFADVPRRLGWRALVHMIRYSDPDSAYGRLMLPPEARITVADRLLQRIERSLRVADWRLTADGQAEPPRNPPEPFPLPGDGALVKGSGGMSIEELEQLLDPAFFNSS